MTSRAVLSGTVVAVIVSILAFRGFLVLPVISIPLAGLLGGAVIGLMLRPGDWSEVAVPGLVVATASTVTTMLVLVGVGGSALEPRYLAGWILCLVLAAAACSLMARAIGALAPRGLR